MPAQDGDEMESVSRKSTSSSILALPNREKESNYWAAVYEGDTEYIRLFLQGDDDNEPEPGITLDLEDARGLPTMHRLAVIGHQDALRFVLDKGAADVNQREGTYGQTALHLSAIKGHVEVVQQLLSCGGDLLATDRVGGWTALHAAARAGQDEVICLLLDRGPPDYVNMRGSRGDTPLHRAAYWGRASTVRLLLSRGADRAALNDDGHDATALVCRGPGADALGISTIRVDLLQPPGMVGCTSSSELS
jgi:ankyrin repeat protein